MKRILIFEDNHDFIDSLTELIANADGMELAAIKWLPANWK